MQRSRWHWMLVYFGLRRADEEPESPWPLVVLITAGVGCLVLAAIGLDWIALASIGSFVVATVVHFARTRRSGRSGR